MKKHILFCLILVSASRAAMSQAVFAPVKGAEWRYYFKSSYYEAPYFQPREGIVTVRYSKDTTINGVLMKKMDRSDDVKYRLEKDTVYYRRPGPLFMTQRNDSVFTLTENGLVLSFVYKAVQGTTTVLVLPFFNRPLNLKSAGVSVIKPINGIGTLERYAYKSLYSVLDLYIEDSIYIFNRIGPFNTDISLIASQGVGFNNSEYYRLICYRDTEVGELRFLDRPCISTLVSVTGPPQTLENNIVLQYDGSNLRILIEDAHNKKFGVDLFDGSGRLLKRHTGVEQMLVLDNLPQGLLLVRVSDDRGGEKTKKIIIHKN
jgi:hypothetical protein